MNRPSTLLRHVISLTRPRYTEADLLVSSDESMQDKNRFILRNAVIRSLLITLRIVLHHFEQNVRLIKLIGYLLPA